MVWDRAIYQAANVTIRTYGDWGSFHAAQRADELMAKVTWTGGGQGNHECALSEGPGG